MSVDKKEDYKDTFLGVKSKIEQTIYLLEICDKEYDFNRYKEMLNYWLNMLLIYKKKIMEENNDKP